MRDAVFVAGRNRSWRDARRALARTVTIREETRDEEFRVYYDTFDGRLCRAGLELIEVGDDVVLRDAATAEPVGQGRWTVAEGPRFARDLAPKELREQVAALTEPRVLQEVVQARATVHDAIGHDDAGQLVARFRSEAIYVRRGERAKTLRGIFVTVPKAAKQKSATSRLRSVLWSAGYRPSSIPWSFRLLAAAGRSAAAYAPMPRVALDETATMRASAVAIFPRLLQKMVRNEPGLREGVDPEFLHDYRVALRQTRTALAELAGVFTADDARGFRARFARLSAPTGRLRDLEVQLGRKVEYAGWVPDAFSPGLELIWTALEHERNGAHSALIEILDTREYAALKRDWKRALVRLSAGQPAGVSADEPALPVVRAAIEKRYARLRAIATSVETLDDAALHRARVQGKKLRYLLEFFARPLGDDAEDAVALIERLQDALGGLHDTNVQIEALETLARQTSHDGPSAHARAGAMGAVMSQLQAQRAKLRRRSTKRLLALVGKKQSRWFERLIEG